MNIIFNQNKLIEIIDFVLLEGGRVTINQVIQVGNTDIGDVK